MIRNIFGKRPSGNRLKRIEASPNYKDGAFRNIEETTVSAKDASFFKMLKAFLNKPKTVRPSKALPSVKTNLKEIPSEKLSLVWFGHSSYMLKSHGFTILVDPVFSGHASPFSFAVKSFMGSDVYNVNDFPTIDLLVISHDHYDHLDFKTIIKLKNKIKKVIAPLGVGEHLEQWGISGDKITELDWWEKTTIEKDIEIRATPARHFSGRDFVRAKSLWASYVLEIHGNKLFLGGDSGYDKQFKLIGEQYGPFDLAILENGQYGENWPQIHMLPEDTVRAAKDLRADVLLPVHWSKFSLALHPWNESVIRVLEVANKMNQKISLPKIGQLYTLGGPLLQEHWWNF